MQWFRRHIGFGARLALLALAIQFALVFGHSHVHAQSAGPIPDAVVAETGAALSQPPADDHDHHDHRPLADGCAICVVASLTASAVFSASPILHLPEAVSFLHRVTDAGFTHLDPACTAFQPRAPPAS